MQRWALQCQQAKGACAGRRFRHRSSAQSRTNVAYAGFCLGGSLYRESPALAPIISAKAELGTAATAWLQRRLAGRTT